MSTDLSPYKHHRSLLMSHLGAFLTVIVWGVSFVSTKVLLDHGLQSVEIYIYRFIMAYVIALALCHERFKANNTRDELLFMVCGLCGGSIYFIAENTALEYTLAANVSLLTSISPLLTTIIIGLLYKAERPGWGVYVGSVVAIVGVACVIFNSSFDMNVNPLGDCLALLAALSFSIYSIVLRRLNALYSVMFITRKTFFYGIVTAMPFLFTQPEAPDFNLLVIPEVWGNLLFLGIMCSMVAYICWAEAVKGIGAITASNYLYLQPVITMIASVFLLGEVVSIIGGTGCALILLGLILSEKLGKRSM